MLRCRRRDQDGARIQFLLKDGFSIHLPLYRELVNGQAGRIENDVARAGRVILIFRCKSKLSDHSLVSRDAAQILQHLGNGRVSGERVVRGNKAFRFLKHTGKDRRACCGRSCIHVLLVRALIRREPLKIQHFRINILHVDPFVASRDVFQPQGNHRTAGAKAPHLVVAQAAVRDLAHPGIRLRFQKQGCLERQIVTVFRCERNQIAFLRLLRRGIRRLHILYGSSVCPGKGTLCRLILHVLHNQGQGRSQIHVFQRLFVALQKKSHRSDHRVARLFSFFLLCDSNLLIVRRHRQRSADVVNERELGIPFRIRTAFCGGDMHRHGVAFLQVRDRPAACVLCPGQGCLHIGTDFRFPFPGDDIRPQAKVIRCQIRQGLCLFFRCQTSQGPDLKGRLPVLGLRFAAQLRDPLPLAHDRHILIRHGEVSRNLRAVHQPGIKYIAFPFFRRRRRRHRPIVRHRIFPQRLLVRKRRFIRVPADHMLMDGPASHHHHILRGHGEVGRDFRSIDQPVCKTVPFHHAGIRSGGQSIVVRNGCVFPQDNSIRLCLFVGVPGYLIRIGIISGQEIHCLGRHGIAIRNRVPVQQPLREGASFHSRRLRSIRKRCAIQHVLGLQDCSSVHRQIAKRIAVREPITLHGDIAVRHTVRIRQLFSVHIPEALREMDSGQDRSG